MTRLARHRGPDGEGFAFYEPANRRLQGDSSDETPEGARTPPLSAGAWALGLGHRRLSILDLSVAGHQPMADAAAEVWITFNGEIYNYRELRAELTALGHRFTTDTDTEAIIAAWREWGEACLPRLLGMFAFVLFDRRTAQLFAARDRFGIKPLYLWRTPGGGTAFASEIKQFTAHPQWRARLDGQRAYDFLNWGLIDHGEATLFADVQQLRGGECLSASLGQLDRATPRCWYQLKAEPFRGDFTAAAERFRALFDDSVRLHLRADVPVGSCLSGGLDSSSIVCTMQAQLTGGRARQNTFSAYSEVARYDERQFINDVVQATGVRAHHTTPEPDALLRELDTLAWHQDEPFGSTSIYAQWCVFRLAREQGVRVMLDGQGADEALGGYHGYFGPRLAGLLRRGRWLRCWREASAVRTLHGQSVGDQARLMLNDLIPPQIADRLRRLAGRTVRAPDFLNLEKLGAEARSPHDRSVDLREPVRSLGLAQLTSLNLPMLLHWEDRDSMAHGVEARVPFLDHKLVEFCLGLPEEHKLADGWTKRVLREGMRGRLPESIRLRRDKLGFATAEEVWMKRQPEVFLHLIDEAIEGSCGILTPAARAKAERMLSGAEPFRFYLWRVISFGAWLRRFQVTHA